MGQHELHHFSESHFVWLIPHSAAFSEIGSLPSRPKGLHELGMLFFKLRPFLSAFAPIFGALKWHDGLCDERSCSCTLSAFNCYRGLCEHAPRTSGNSQV